jgi:hypothetical protein
LHGQIHHTAARQVAAENIWCEDEMEMKISGVMKETSIFGGCLRLSRQIRSRLGENEIFIQDEVRNMGFQRCPHMILYHFNFGFPLLTEKTLITTSIQPREIETPLNGYREWQAPDANYLERVYYHQSQGIPEVQIVNSSFPLHDGVAKAKVQASFIGLQIRCQGLYSGKCPGLERMF